VEASFAGALGVRLGGTLSYGGRVEHRPVLNGESVRAVGVHDVERAVRLSRRVTWLALGVSVAGRLLSGRNSKGRTS
jgi:adenosylcobinamide-phosphate synthase